MKVLAKTLNRFNGNICFVGKTDTSKDIIFECSRNDRSLSYVATSYATSVCLNDHNSYLVAYGNSSIGKFENGALTSGYLTVSGNAHQIYKSHDGELFYLDKSQNELVKDGSWQFKLPRPQYASDGHFEYRESDQYIIYSNNRFVYWIRDDGSSAVMINSLSMDEESYVHISVESQTKGFSYIRCTAVSGADLEQSSSSSSSSSLSSSSSTSLSSLSSLSSSSSVSESSVSSSSLSIDSSSSSVGESSSSSSSSSGAVALAIVGQAIVGTSQIP